VGTGIVISGADRAVASDNFVYDQWRWGMLVRSVPAGNTADGNVVVGNRFGVSADGTRTLNGLDVVWDGEGAGNCWSGNAYASGRGRRSDPATLPGCPNSGPPGIPNPIVVGRLLPCAAWDRVSNPRPIGCEWFDTPRKPS
jgi:hypothetical protein